MNDPKLDRDPDLPDHRYGNLEYDDVTGDDGELVSGMPTIDDMLRDS